MLNGLWKASVKWSIFYHINKQGFHSHHLCWPFRYEFLSLENAQEKQCLLSGSYWAALPTLPRTSTEEFQEGKDRMLTPDSWDAYEMNDFSRPRFLYLPINTKKKNKKTLNSLIWNIWFYLINSNLLIFRLPIPCCKLLYNLTLSSFFLSPNRTTPSSEQFYQVIWEAISWAWSLKNSVQFSRSVASDSLRPHELQHARPPCPSPTPGVYPNSRPSSRWCHPAISFSVVSFSSWPQSLPASGTFPMSQLFAWGGQSFGVSASASVLSMNIQDWSPLGWTGWISLQSKGLTRVFSSITVQNQFFSAQLSSQSNSHIHTWPLEKP